MKQLLRIARKPVMGILCAVTRFLPVAALTLLASAAHGQTYNLQSAILGFDIEGGPGSDCTASTPSPLPAVDSSGKLTITFGENCPAEGYKIINGTATFNVPTSITLTGTGILTSSQTISGSASATIINPGIHDQASMNVTACSSVPPGNLTKNPDGSVTVSTAIGPCPPSFFLEVGDAQTLNANVGIGAMGLSFRIVYSATAAQPTISISRAIPSNIDPLSFLAQDLPPFCAYGTLNNSGTNPVQVYLQLLDQNQNPIVKTKSPPTLQAGSTTWGDAGCNNPKKWVILPAAPIPQIPVPASATYNQVLATYNLQAVLVDSVTMQPLVTSASIPYKMELDVDLTAQLQSGERNRFSLDPPYFGLITLNPAQNVFLSTSRYSGLEDAISTAATYDSPVLLMDDVLDFAGSKATLDTVVTQADSSGEVLSVWSSLPESISQGQKIEVKPSIYGSLAKGAATVSFTNRLQLANTQTILFPPIQFGVENVTITTATPGPDDCLAKFSLKAILKTCPLLGAPAKFTFSGTVLGTSTGEQLFRVVAVGSGSGTATQVPVQINPGKPVAFSDSLTVNLPAEIKTLTIAYVLTGGGASPSGCLVAGQCAFAGRVYKSFIAPSDLPLLSANANTVNPIADGTLTLLASQTSQQVQSAVTEMNVANSTLQDIASVGLASSFGLARAVSPFATRPVSTSAFPSGNQILSSLPISWVFSPAIPHDGTFSASLALDYSSVTLPDDPNFSESKLQVISVDPAGGLHVYQTSIDLVNHIATATVDGLDPYVSLAVVGQSGQTPIMLASAGSGYALVNGGSQNANITQTPFDSNGTGTAATASL